jgi:hypothetical protein
VAKQNDEPRSEQPRLGQGGLNDHTRQAAGAVGRADDDPAESNDGKSIALDLDFDDDDPRRGDEPARLILQSDVPVLRSEAQWYPGGIEWIGLVAFERLPMWRSQRAEFDDLHTQHGTR